MYSSFSPPALFSLYFYFQLLLMKNNRAFAFMALYYFLFFILFIVLWPVQQVMRDSCPMIMSPNASITSFAPYFSQGGGSNASTVSCSQWKFAIYHSSSLMFEPGRHGFRRCWRLPRGRTRYTYTPCEHKITTITFIVQLPSSQS